MHTNFTYGFLQENQLENILHAAGKSLPRYFIDLGCGHGELCQEAVKLGVFEKVFGIELLPKRLYRALLQKNQHITYLYGNLFQKLPMMEQETFAYLCSTCFNAQLQKAISEHLQKNSHYKIVASLKPLPLSSQYWKLKTRIFVECSWDRAPCYIYERHH